MKKVLKRIFNIFVDVVVVLILVVSMLIVVLSLTSNSSGVPHIFGIAPLSVQTESMMDTINPGDLIFSEVIETVDYEFKVGDIVTFPIKIDGKEVLNTHRIVDIIEDSENDITYYQTQGDNEKTNPEPDEEYQTGVSIVAKYTDFKIPGLGNVFSFIRTQLGFFLCVLLPMIIFFVYEAIRVIMNLIAYNKEKAIEEAQNTVNNSELTEEQKQKAIEEYLASIGEKQATGNESSVQTPAQDEMSNVEE